MSEENINNNQTPEVNTGNQNDKNINTPVGENSTDVNNDNDDFDVDSFIKGIQDSIDSQDKATKDTFKQTTESIVKNITQHTAEKMAKMQEKYNKQIEELTNKMNSIAIKPSETTAINNPNTPNNKPLSEAERKQAVKEYWFKKLNL